MERIRRHISYANVAATLALVLAMSGGAVAATGGFSSGGQLKACVNGEGTLKLLKPGKKCKKGQTQVAWSQTGPAGVKGASGANGAPGATGAKGAPGTNGKEGPQGLSAGFQAFNDKPGNFGPAGAPGKILGRLAVPAGNYFVTAKVIVSAQASEPQCRLENNETADADISEAIIDPGEQTMSLEATAAFSAPGEWVVKCTTLGTVEVESRQLKIQAIQVASRSNVPG